jgi:hypothetical protein
MLSVRNTMGLIVAVALGVVIGMFVQARQTSNPSAHYSFAAVESAIGDDLNRVAVKAAPEHWFPRASTYEDEVAKINHEGF